MSKSGIEARISVKDVADRRTRRVIREALGRAAAHTKFDNCDIFPPLAIALLPFVLLAINDNWIFCKPGYRDSWFYSGFHLHLPEFLRAYGGSYYASRVPWTVAGWLLHSAFDDEHALYVLHFGVFYLAVFSLYFAVRTIFANAAAAGAAALLFGTHSYFLAAAGWDYVDGASIACLLAAFAALASAAIQLRWRSAAFMWGVATCAMVSIYVLLLVLVPIQIGTFLLLNQLRAKRSLVAVTALFVAGGVAALLLFGITNWLLGGPFSYFMGQVNALSTVAQNRDLFWSPFLEWASNAQWLFVVAITFAFSCAYVLLNARSVAKKMRLSALGADREISLFVCCLANIAASLVFVGLEIDHFYVLQVDYRYNALLPFAYLTIGGALAVMIKRPSSLRQLEFLVAVAAIVLVPWLLSTLGYIFPRRDWYDGLALEGGWAIGGSILLLFVVQRSRRLCGAALAVLFFSILNLGAPEGRIHYPPDPTFKPMKLAVFDASRAIAPYDSGARAGFWLDPNGSGEKLLMLGSIVYSYLGDAEVLPSRSADGGEKASIGWVDRIVLLTSTGDDPVALANAGFADQELSFEQVAKIEINRPGVAIRMFITDVKRDLSQYEEIAARQAFSEDLPSKVVTPSEPGAYAVIVPLSDALKKQNTPGYVRIRLRVDRGTLGVGILTGDQRDFIDRPLLTAPFEMGDVFLKIPNLSEAGPLVFLNGQNNTQAAVGLVESASVYVRVRSAQSAGPPAVPQ